METVSRLLAQIDPEVVSETARTFNESGPLWTLVACLFFGQGFIIYWILCVHGPRRDKEHREEREAVLMAFREDLNAIETRHKSETERFLLVTDKFSETLVETNNKLAETSKELYNVRIKLEQLHK